MIAVLRSSKARAFVKIAVFIGAPVVLIWVNQKVSIRDLKLDFVKGNEFAIWEAILNTLQKTAFVAAGLVVSGFQLRTRVIDILQKDYFNSSQLDKLESLVSGCTKRLSSIMVRLVLTAAFMALSPLLAEALGLGLIVASCGSIALAWAVVDFLAILSSFDQLEEFTLDTIKRFKREQESEKLNKTIRETTDTPVNETIFSASVSPPKRRNGK
jgi:hypothetical protein